MSHTCLKAFPENIFTIKRLKHADVQNSKMHVLHPLDVASQPHSLLVCKLQTRWNYIWCKVAHKNMEEMLLKLKDICPMSISFSLTSNLFIERKVRYWDFMWKVMIPMLIFWISPCSMKHYFSSTIQMTLIINTWFEFILYQIHQIGTRSKFIRKKNIHILVSLFQ